MENIDVKDLTLEELDEVAGGSRSDERHNLKNYIDCVVTNLKSGEYLYFLYRPNGSKMSIRYQNGESIKIHPRITTGYFLAYDWRTDKYGYVDAHYIK